MQPEAYTNKRFFELEKKNLTKNNWFYACSSLEIAKENDYVLKNIMGWPIIIQRFKSGIKAFVNICSHRGSPIRIKDAGNGIMKCPYHGWIYDHNGAPIGIPNCEKMFGVKKDKLKKRKLAQLKVSKIGIFIFVNFGKNPSPLDKYLGNFSSILENLNEKKFQIEKSFKHKLNTNWKLSVENSLDEYHIVSIHPQTFGSRGFLKESFYEYSSTKKNSGLFYHPNVEKKGRESYFGEISRKKDFENDSYSILYIFPNFQLISLLNTILVAQTFNPNSEKLTIQENVYFSSKKRHKKSDSTIANQGIKYLETIFHEDVGINNHLQNNIANLKYKPLLGKQEFRIKGFQKNYSRSIK